MTNEIYSSGLLIPLVAPSGGVVAGVPLLVGNLVVVPINSADAGEIFAAKRGCVVQVAKATGTGVITQGTLVDWDPAPGNVVAAGSVQDNFPLGYLLEDVATGDTTAKVVLLTHSVSAHA